MDSKTDYWRDCIADAAEDCGLVLTPEQRDSMAKVVEGAHENYGMAFYSPPSTDRLAQNDRDWQAKLDALQRTFDTYRGNAETAVRRALRQYPDAQVSIGDGGEVTRWNGRAEVIR